MDKLSLVIAVAALVVALLSIVFINDKLSEDDVKQLVREEITSRPVDMGRLVLSGLETVNYDGAVMVEMGSYSEGGFLRVYNSDSNPAATLLGSSQEGSILGLNDTDGVTQVSFGLTGEGQGMLQLANAQETVTSLGADSSGGFGFLQLRNGQGQIVFQVGSPDGDGELQLIDLDGSPVFTAPPY